MISSQTEKSKICNFDYLYEMMGGRKNVLKEIMDAFLKQIPDELKRVNDAVLEKDYVTVKNFAHTMKSSVSIMGISVLTPILQELEELGAKGTHMERIKELNEKLYSICMQAIEEVKTEKLNYA